MPNLSIIEGKNKGALFPFSKEEIFLGRATDVDISLKDLRSSRRHARIFQKGLDYYIEDIHSQNGTYLNGKKIQAPCKLQNKDQIRIGNTILVFSLELASLAKGNYFYGYQIQEKLLEDNTGAIYWAEQSSLKRDVLLWILPIFNIEKVSQPMKQMQELFLQQISYIANLFHRNLHMLIDFAITDQYFYCSFEKVDLEATIRKYIEDNSPIRLEKAVSIAMEIASGMAYAHDNKTLHLHLTSHNILVQPSQRDRVVLREFGVARFISEATISDVTKSTGILGVTEYISPEQITEKESVRPETDIYSYGCLLYHLFTGHLPFEANSSVALAKMHVSDKPLPITQYRENISSRLVKLVEKCMEKEVKKRFTSFHEILEILQEITTENSFESSDFLKLKAKRKTPWLAWIFFPMISAILSILFFCYTDSIINIMKAWLPI
ncbi:MAG: protein kinase [Planctomycetes bacterium]|jgi:serine/threonine protein kinase|nr:protein kinase [Planctomycetota bacterium]HPY74639.1 FHA domain-containing serine/threonine-protein kinase [Planctomycetota bacterium]HQB00365.1 FHA domain-containing serine/threonine-protein kinase [Planctomycetota bacterium]